MATTAQGELDDGTYRMRIEDRYKRNATNRKLIKIASIAQIVYICVRTFWKLMPFMLIGASIGKDCWCFLDVVIVPWCYMLSIPLQGSKSRFWILLYSSQVF